MKENKRFLANIEVIADAKKKNQIIPLQIHYVHFFHLIKVSL